MTTLVLKANKKNFPALLGDEKINLFHLGFLCYYNTLIGLQSWDSFSQKKAESKIKEAKENFANTEDKPQYFVNLPSDAKAADRERTVVLKSTESFNGVTDDSNFEGLEAFGTILRDGNKYYIETDLELIERIRRDEEIQGIKSGRRHIGFEGVVDGDYEGNAVRYESYLANLDAEKGQMVTRGFYL